MIEAGTAETAAAVTAAKGLPMWAAHSFCDVSVPRTLSIGCEIERKAAIGGDRRRRFRYRGDAGITPDRDSLARHRSQPGHASKARKFPSPAVATNHETEPEPEPQPVARPEQRPPPVGGQEGLFGGRSRLRRGKDSRESPKTRRCPTSPSAWCANSEDTIAAPTASPCRRMARGPLCRPGPDRPPWNVATGNEVHRVDHDGPVYAVAFSADGSRTGSRGPPTRP